MQVSLLDTSGMRTNEWYVVYRRREPYYWFAKWMDPNFRHVELTRPIYYGTDLSQCLWLQVKPNFEMLEVDFECDPVPPWIRDPTCTVQKVTASRRLTTIRDPFFMGPQTCTEIVKACLGIRSFWIRTPKQLYEFIRRRSCVIVSR